MVRFISEHKCLVIVFTFLDTVSRGLSTDRKYLQLDRILFLAFEAPPPRTHCFKSVKMESLSTMPVMCVVNVRTAL